MVDKSFQNRRENALRWLEVFRRPIGVGCILQTEEEYKQYLGAIYYILLDIQYQNERIKKTNRWRSFIGTKEKSRYTIYYKIGDTHYHRSYTNKLAELCAILKLRHNVKKENYVEPIVLRGDPRFVEYGNGYSYEHYISDKHCQMLSGEIVTCMILADAMRVDFYLSSSSEEYIRSHSYEEILKHYEKELYSKHKEPIPTEIIIGKPLYDGDDVKYTISTGYPQKVGILIWEELELKSEVDAGQYTIKTYLECEDYVELCRVNKKYQRDIQKYHKIGFTNFLQTENIRLYQLIENRVKQEYEQPFSDDLIVRDYKFCIINNLPK